MTQRNLVFPPAWLNLDKFLPDYSSVISLFFDHHLEKTSNCKSVFVPLRYKPPSLLITLQPRNTLYYFSTGSPQHLRTLPILISSELSYISPLAQLNKVLFACLLDLVQCFFDKLIINNFQDIKIKRGSKMTPEKNLKMINIPNF